ncbi:MAG TPA: hypothetical protein VJ553_02125, partial [Candidatus Paceibacterota bacterium]|nr:hypothetical protein [Candidatus Paceibacterota bacterium]
MRSNTTFDNISTFVFIAVSFDCHSHGSKSNDSTPTTTTIVLFFIIVQSSPCSKLSGRIGDEFELGRLDGADVVA